MSRVGLRGQLGHIFWLLCLAVHGTDCQGLAHHQRPACADLWIQPESSRLKRSASSLCTCHAQTVVNESFAFSSTLWASFHKIFPHVENGTLKWPSSYPVFVTLARGQAIFIHYPAVVCPYSGRFSDPARRQGHYHAGRRQWHAQREELPASFAQRLTGNFEHLLDQWCHPKVHDNIHYHGPSDKQNKSQYSVFIVSQS